MTLGLIWAQSRNGVIGADGTIPWRVPQDVARFRELTLGHPVLMGRATWDSLPARFRPLPGRRNLVLTRDRSWTAPGAEAVHDLDEALAALGGGDAWVIGGAEVYRATIDRADRLAVTVLDADVAGDALAPDVGPSWAASRRDPDAGWHETDDGLRFAFVDYERATPGVRSAR